MIRVRQQVPAYVEGAAPKVAEVADEAALLAIPWIAAYAVDDVVERTGTVAWWDKQKREHTLPIIYPPSGRRFTRWSVDRSTRHLMVECDEGRWWWVVAYIQDGLEHLSLPEWRIPPDSQGRDEGSRERFIASQVPYLCAVHRVYPTVCGCMTAD